MIAAGIEAQPVQRIARERAVIRDAAGECTCAIALHRFAQGDIIDPQVARGEIRHLVVHHMRFVGWRRHDGFSA
jgi:hypothetical protein